MFLKGVGVMFVNTTFDAKQSTFTIKVIGCFYFNIHKFFRHATEQIKPSMRVIHLDLGGTRDIDVAGLAMLLILLDCVNKNQQKLKIINAQSRIIDVLDAANIKQLFCM